MSNPVHKHRQARNERADMPSAHVTTGTAGGRWSKLAAGIAAALALVTLAACGGDDGENGDDTDDPETNEEASGTNDTEATDPEDATSTTLPEEEQEILDDYDAAVEALIAAYDPPSPEHPDLLATHAGETLTRLQVILGDMQVAGYSEEWLNSEYKASVESIAADTAVVHDCYKETTQLVNTETRAPREEPDEGSALRKVDMERIDGTWKVVHGETLEESCEPNT